MVSKKELDSINIEKLAENVAFLANLKTVADKEIGNYPKGAVVESKDLLKPIWNNYDANDQRKLGKSFRQLVEHGHYPKVKFVGKKSNHHAQYEILV